MIRNKKAIYDNRVRKILDMMKYMTRDDVARKLKYKGWKGLDSYMRRKNFLFDSKNHKYIPAESKVSKQNSDPKNYAPVKVVSIISSFEKPDADPKFIAKKTGFKNHKEMAKYMKAKGYEWNINKNNYVKSVGKIKGNEKEITDTLTPSAKEKLPESIEEYIPFIRFLYEKRDKIYHLLSDKMRDGKIPRYALPGMARTKAFYMNDMVARLVAEFSNEKNVTQREIIEAAIIEYLAKYGYKLEVESLLNSI